LKIGPQIYIFTLAYILLVVSIQLFAAEPNKPLSVLVLLYGLTVTLTSYVINVISSF